MGQTASTQNNHGFSETEIQNLKTKITGSTSTNECLALDTSVKLKNAIHKLVCAQLVDQKNVENDVLYFDAFLKTCRLLLNATPADAQNLAHEFDGSFTQFIKELVESATPLLVEIAPFQFKFTGPDRLTDFIVNFYNQEGIATPYADLKDCYCKGAYLQKIWNLLFTHMLLPSTDKKHTESQTSKKSLLIDAVSAFIISSHLESNQIKPEWSLLYSSKINGKSWTIFLERLEYASQCLIVVRDTTGSKFGAFASTPLRLNPKFTGDSNTFLFGTAPNIRISTASGINSNFIYLNSNQKTYPNGIGFGGQLEYFGLWLDSSFETGYCRAEPISTTFSSPCFTPQQVFTIDMIEVWMVKGKSEEEMEKDSAKKSILNQTEAAALLEMNGRTMYSHNLHDPEPEDAPA